jgi:hypothetical protein
MMQEEPTAGQPKVPPEYVPGITGWLAFFSLVVWVMPLLLSFYLIRAWIESSREVQTSIGRPLNFSVVYLLLQQVPNNWDAALFFAYIGMQVALIGVSIWLITQWRRRMRQFPRNWIIFQVGLLVIAIIVLVVENDPQPLRPRGAILSVVNILFWWRSSRVAATFTQ